MGSQPDALARAWEACRAYRYAEAEAFFHDAIRADPRRVDAHLGLGDAFAYQNRHEDAVRRYELARSLFAGDPRPAAKAGEAWYKLGRLPRARAALEASLAAAPSARAHLLLGRVLEAEGKPRRAAAHYRAAADDEFPGDSGPLARLDRIEAGLRARRFAEAFALADEFYRDDPTQNGVDGIKTALRPAASGEPRARAGYLKALEACARRRPRDPWPAAALLLAAADAGRTKAELRRRARRLVALSAGRGWMLSLVSEFTQDLEEIAPALASASPGHWKIRAGRAERLFSRGSRARALRDFAKLIGELSGQARADAVAWRGELRLWSGDYAAALEDFDAGLAGGARYAGGWRGAALVCLGRRDEALRALDAALAESPVDSEILTWRGEVLRALGRLPEALRDLRAASALDGNVWARINIALVRRLAGEEKEFRAELARLPAGLRALLPRRGDPEPALRRLLERARGSRRKDHDLRFRRARF